MLRPQSGAPATGGRPQLCLQQACVWVLACVGQMKCRQSVGLLHQARAQIAPESPGGSLRRQPAGDDMLCMEPRRMEGSRVHKGCLRQVACFQTQSAVSCCTWRHHQACPWPNHRLKASLTDSSAWRSRAFFLLKVMSRLQFWLTAEATQPHWHMLTRAHKEKVGRQSGPQVHSLGPAGTRFSGSCCREGA